MTSPKFMIGGQAALTDKSMIGCALGGIIRINDTGQKSFCYGSVESNLLADKSKEDEETIKNQQEGKEAKEKIMTVVTVLRKTKMEGYKKEVEVTLALNMEENRGIEVEHNNQKYKLFIGKLIDEHGNTISKICWHEENGKSAFADGQHEVTYEKDKGIKIGDFGLVDYTDKEKFYKSNKHITLGNNLEQRNKQLTGSDYKNHYNLLFKRISNRRDM